MDQDRYNRSGFLIFIISMVGTFALFFYLIFVHPGVQGIDQVAEVATDAGDNAQATASAEKVKEVNPDEVESAWVSSPEMIAAGQKVYSTNCALCHGASGKADGPAATAQTRNLVKGNWKAGGTSIALYKTLQNGLEGTGMVSFKAQVSKNNRWALVHYIRSITENKEADDTAKLEAFAKTAD